MRRWILIAALACVSMTAACATPSNVSLEGLQAVEQPAAAHLPPDVFSQLEPGIPVKILRDPRREHRRVAIVTADWFYCYPKTGAVYRVPASYVTDFASIPPAARALINPTGDEMEAALVHDWLYAVGESNGRERADEIFSYVLGEQHVDIIRRGLMHSAVSLFGGAAYGSEREWTNFADPTTLVHVSPPIERPRVAAVTQMDCRGFDNALPELRRRYHTRYSP